MNNNDFQRLLLTSDKELVTALSKPQKKKSSAGKERERPEKGKGKGKGKGKRDEDGEKGGGKGKPSGGQAAGPQGPQYRDRAKERREEKGEYETIAQEFASHGEVSVDESKYLGGDTEHTHLVKGLDFSLLNKVRTELAKQGKLDEVAEERARRKAGKQEKRQFASELGKRVWLSVLETLHPHHNGFAKRLQNMGRALSLGQRIRGTPSMFLPGRMFYEFDTGASAGSSDIPRTVFASKEDAPHADKRRWVAPVMPNTVQTVREGLQRAADAKKQRKQNRAAQGTTQASATAYVPQKIVQKRKAKDEDEDIFGGIGAFDPSEAARKAKAERDAKERRSGGAKEKEKEKKPSYFADAGARKYQEAPEGQLDLDELDYDENEKDNAAKKLEAAIASGENVKFEAAERFMGPRPGWVFKTGPKGLGYYCEGKEAAAEANKSVGFTITGPRDPRGRPPEQDKKKRKADAAPAWDDDDAYGECFPGSGLGNAMVTTGTGLDDQEEEEGPKVKGKLTANAPKGGGGGGGGGKKKKRKGSDSD